MKLDKRELLLYAVTDRRWLKGKETLEQQVEKAIKSGVTIVQVREKNISKQDFINKAKKIKQVCSKHNVKCIVNDDVKVCLEIDADGIHIGQSDMNAKDVRKLIGDDKIIGVSVQTVNQAKLAKEIGADYLGVGAVFSTSTKSDACNVSFDTLKDICESVDIPVVAIGGIDKSNIEKLKGSKISGIAVVSAIFAQEDIYTETIKLKEIAQKVVSGG